MEVSPMSIVLMIHSLMRWLIVLVAIIASVKFALGWARQATVAKNDRMLMSIFGGLVDLQALLGIIFLLWNGLGTPIGFPMFRIEHAITMIVALLVAHLPAAWKKNETATALRNNLFVVAGVIVVVVLGIGVLPGNRWTFNF
jgi:hypothetical protein